MTRTDRPPALMPRAAGTPILTHTKEVHGVKEYFSVAFWRSVRWYLRHPDRPPLSGYDRAICPRCTRAGRGWEDGSAVNNPGVVTFDPEGSERT
ncbi:hypothetical protein ACIP79_00585 [Streptomyces sp. NPDC088747]|uniref:hypothetical protein n=1 Tax=Streptomyces sp. NPDC088747 TaxID=3365886 RepID=UPI00382EE249